MMEFLIGLGIILWLVWIRSGWDDTDKAKGEGGWFSGSSGLMIKNDYGTGLQYLVTPFGGITPRLDADGDHMKIPKDD